MKQPEHMAGPAFEEARDKIAHLVTQLSEAQKAQYAAFVKEQKKDKEEQKQKAERTKAEYEQAKEKRPGLVKNYDPPIKIKDPYLQQKALKAQAEHQKLNNLTRTQQGDKVRFLEKLEERQDKARHEFARAAIDGKAKTDFQQAAKGDQTKDDLTTRALARIRKKKEERDQGRGRDDRDEGRGRDD